MFSLFKYVFCSKEAPIGLLELGIKSSGGNMKKHIENDKILDKLFGQKRTNLNVSSSYAFSSLTMRKLKDAY